jgi:hypothetical protein
MYTYFRIKNYAGFKDLELKDFARVNLIAGKNNVGKTSLLHAIFMYSNPFNPDLAFNTLTFRGLRQFRIEFGRWADSPVDIMFHSFNTSEPILMDGSNNQYGNWKLKIQIVDDITDLNTLGMLNQPATDDDETLQSSAGNYQAIVFIAQPENKDEARHYFLLDSRGTKHTVPIAPTPDFLKGFAVFLPPSLRCGFDLFLISCKVIYRCLSRLEFLTQSGWQIFSAKFNHIPRLWCLYKA